MVFLEDTSHFVNTGYTLAQHKIFQRETDSTRFPYPLLNSIFDPLEHILKLKGIGALCSNLRDADMHLNVKQDPFLV